MKSPNNPLLCNPETGICELPGSPSGSTGQSKVTAAVKPVKIIYYTDPICSSCWGIEPQLRKLKLEYGDCVDIEYKMGGLLPDWSYNSGGISKPSDVAQHWDEVSKIYDMPIDGDVWLEHPLASSYPPSIAFKAAQLQDPQKAILFLREIREMVFLQKKNITEWPYLALAAKSVGLDPEQLKHDYQNRATTLFNQDLDLGRTLGIRGFPTLLLTNAAGKTEIVYGSKPYEIYEGAIQQLYPAAAKYHYDRSMDFLFATYQTLTAKEFSVLSGKDRALSEQLLDAYSKDGKLNKTETKNGAIWKLNTSRP